MRVLFLVPARGGSKGIPEKNLRTVAGISLVGGAVLRARKAAAAFPHARVVCSTDSQAIAEEARAWGAEVPFLRTSNLATDDAHAVDVALDALTRVGDTTDTLCLVQPTSPLAEHRDLLDVVALVADGADAAVAVVRGPPLEWIRRDQGAFLMDASTAASDGRRQTCTPTLFPCGAAYAIRASVLRECRTFMPAGRTRYSVLHDQRGLDVDDEDDLAMADVLARGRHVQPLRVGERLIGPGHPCFVVAEAGVNHHGNLQQALALVDAAAATGADAVKFQTFQPNQLASEAAPLAAYQRAEGMTTQRDLLGSLTLPPPALAAVAARARERGILFFSSPFDEGSVDLLVDLGVPVLKVPSGEITNIPYLRHISRTSLPVILSTGMSSMVEVAEALLALHAHHPIPICLLHCVSSYPSPLADANVRAMETLRAAFQLPVGLSDHSTTSEATLAAAALGACVIERHLTLNRELPGPDQKASRTEEELRNEIQSLRRLELALGRHQKGPQDSELETARVARKSLHWARALPKGTMVAQGHLVALRPGTGLPPRELERLVGTHLTRNVEREQMVVETDVQR